MVPPTPYNCPLQTVTTRFDDPATSVFVRVGSRTDSVYTSTALPYLGCFWNHATTAAEKAVYDNSLVPE